jgi:hypothetical protein
MVMQGELPQGIDMGQFHREDVEIIGRLLSVHHLVEWYGQLETIALRLAVDFPGTDDTQRELVGGICTRRQGGGREVFRAAIHPQKGMGIQPQPHGVPLSQKLSGSGSSKAGRIHIVPPVLAEDPFVRG